MIPGYDEWKTMPPDDAPVEINEKLNGSGYTEMGTWVFVPEEDAYSYALERVSNGTAEEKKEFVDWFYSNWIKEEGCGSDQDNRIRNHKGRTT